MAPAAVAWAGSDATGVTPPMPVAVAPAVAHQRINPTNRVLRFIVPLTDGPSYLGDVELSVKTKTGEAAR